MPKLIVNGIEVEVPAGALGDPALELRAEVANQPLDRPGGRVAQCADRMAFDLLGDV